LTNPFNLQHPELVNGILDSIQSISDVAKSVLTDPELSRDTLLSALSVTTPFFINQHYLTLESTGSYKQEP
jgi:hypothetical protein